MDKINILYKDFFDFVNEGAFFSGFVRLGEIVVLSGDKNKFQFPQKVNLIVASEEVEKNVYNECVNVLKVLKRVLSIGTVFNDDELMQILTLRLQLFLVSKIIDFSAFRAEVQIIDSDFKRISVDKKNLIKYKSTLDLLNKRWKNVFEVWNNLQNI